MDGHQFDALLTRAVAARRSLLTSLLAGVIGGTAIDVAESKRKKKKKKKKKLSGPFKPCKRERDCLPKHSCFANECVPECERSEQCPFGYFCVRLDEIDLDRGRISWVSPLAKALMKAGEGDTVVLRAPGGTERLEILDVSYKRVDIEPFVEPPGAESASTPR